jgi:predicted ATPase/class 3 adenylate cyclase
MRFCTQCGAPLAGRDGWPTAIAPPADPVAERRLVSVLFADLVGFTTVSEARDPEDVRELLTRYFDACRSIIERYGGALEKFIGDAVMAVWGSPTAREDDAERAVRAALELVAVVPELDASLNLRAGVLTGEAAVTLGAEGQGMVAGDLVNTASRIQASAEPGTVFVGEATKRATEAAIAYGDARLHELKGKATPVPLFRALRVVAGTRGALRSEVLEAPCVGRDHELRLLKELFHASADERKAQLVSVSGIAGVGKSRLAWEFEKYLDGLATEVWWHRGRCLSYGPGVAYWALAEMVRMRCGIAEDENPAEALGKLRAGLDAYLSDPGERRWVEPRLAHLLGLEEGAPGDQENLFAAWRTLFERLAEQGPTVLVFEDMQWADAGLLDFLEYLLDWSRSHPLFVLVFARPEFADKRPSWGAAKRGFASLRLEPLPEPAMDAMLGGLVPGLPRDLHSAILERAAGIPLYAVETVRMLLNRGLLEQAGSVYRPTGQIEALEVPETLHALIAARLDGLLPRERRLVQDSSVLGRTFTRQGLESLTGLPKEELERVLSSLVHKEVLSIQADPRSPERGQYAFLQDVMRRVAYETLSKRERKAKHLAAAEFLSSTWGADEGEIADVVAAHYVDAYEAVPDDPDAADVRAKARGMLTRAGDRAASLAANAEAQRSYERAVELADDAGERAELHERAGEMAYVGTRADATAGHYERAIELFQAEGQTHAAARVSARRAELLWDRGRLEQGLASMQRAFDVLSLEEPDADLAALAAQLARFMYFSGQHPRALEHVETALGLAETLFLPEVLAEALDTKAILLLASDRAIEALALLRTALEVAVEHDRPSAALRAYYNLADASSQQDRYEEAAERVQSGLELARKVGNRYWEWAFLGHRYAFFCRGNWDEVLAGQTELGVEDWSRARVAFATLLTSVVPVNVHRGRIDDAERDVRLFAELGTSADLQERAQHSFAMATVLLARGDAAAALEAAQAAVETSAANGVRFEAVKEAYVVAIEAALRSGDRESAERLIAAVEAMPPGGMPQFLRAHASRFRARLGSPRADDLFKGAAALFRELGLPFYLAVTNLEHAEWLAACKRPGDLAALVSEARAIFERLGAGPWLERVAAVDSQQLEGLPEAGYTPVVH